MLSLYLHIDSPFLFTQEDIEGKDDTSRDGWTGEKYEVVAPKGVAEAFLKFSKRLARSPEQCLRLG